MERVVFLPKPNICLGISILIIWFEQRGIDPTVVIVFNNKRYRFFRGIFSAKIYPQGSRKGEMAQMNCESVSFGF
ncbi:hypothetical protein CS387_01380 [Porphyromonas gingivalis]|nr:hypothetical protein CS387_01380 [Porphyromonas gingivalis]